MGPACGRSGGTQRLVRGVEDAHPPLHTAQVEETASGAAALGDDDQAVTTATAGSSVPQEGVEDGGVDMGRREVDDDLRGASNHGERLIETRPDAAVVLTVERDEPCGPAKAAFDLNATVRFQYPPPESGRRGAVAR